MSYFGFALLARHVQKLADLECVSGIDSFADVDESSYSGGWRLAYVDSAGYGDPGELAADLAAETGAPAIAMSINDTVFAVGACRSPEGNSCEFYLDEQALLAYYAEFDEEDRPGSDPRRNAAAVDVLLRWAAEAGLAADREGLVLALASSPGPLGDGVDRLVRALGIR